MKQQTLNNSETTKNIHAPAGIPWVHPPRSGPDATCIRVPFLTAPLCAFGHQPLFGGGIICSDNHCSWRFWTWVSDQKKACKKRRWTIQWFYDCFLDGLHFVKLLCPWFLQPGMTHWSSAEKNLWPRCRRKGRRKLRYNQVFRCFFGLWVFLVLSNA